MRWHELLLAAGMTVLSASGAAANAHAGASEDPGSLAKVLDLTGDGVSRWLKRLGVTRDGPHTERLLAVNLTGELLMERQGDSSSVRVDSDLDDLLLRPDMNIVLVHNHPANVGLSLGDMRHLTKPGVAAMVVIGHDGSVYVAAAGPRIDRPRFAERQYSAALAVVRGELRLAWPAGRLSIAAGDAHTSHLVALALAKAGIIRYWFKFRGGSLVSYEDARAIFNRIVIVAADRLRRTSPAHTGRDRD
jgi:hypothetical protein